MLYDIILLELSMLFHVTHDCGTIVTMTDLWHHISSSLSMSRNKEKEKETQK